MRLLLDTHIFLWYITGDPRLPNTPLQLIRESSNDVYLSVVSVWEVLVKYQLGRLSLPQPPIHYVPQQRERHRIASLRLDEESVAKLPELPHLHRDPFDRMLLCQANRHGLTLVSADEAIRTYADFVSIIP